MKILHINSYYSTSPFYKNLYNEQIKSGLDIKVYVPVPEAYISEYDFGDYTRLSRNHGTYDRLIFQVKHRKIYGDIVKTYDINNFALLHAHSLFSNGYIAYKLKKNFAVPYIVAVRDTDVNVFFKYMLHLRRLGIEILKEANAVIFLSPTYKTSVIEKYIPNQLKREIEDKARIVPNGIDDFWLQNKGKPKKLTNQKKLNLLTVGLICRRKNQFTTIKAIRLLQRKGFEIKYTVVGKVKDKKLYRRIKNLPYVQYISHSSKEELLKIYRENDIFVMPSVTETFGLVYAEAMSQGLPVIYTRGQGFDGQFEEGEVGYSVNSLDIDDIAKKVVSILNNFNEISKRCIRVVDRFNWNKIANDYSRVYKSILLSSK